ncbi:hypothetical protein QBC45DRAFT_404677 [Copromyces sp. CBS 386.78]|nr:hypothetical protein QBC45DRAFT_404677 [Copromyces sp. CBS 386.78]
MCATWGLGRTQGGEEAKERRKKIKINKEVGGCPLTSADRRRLGKRSSHGVTQRMKQGKGGRVGWVLLKKSSPSPAVKVHRITQKVGCLLGPVVPFVRSWGFSQDDWTRRKIGIRSESDQMRSPIISVQSTSVSVTADRENKTDPHHDLRNQPPLAPSQTLFYGFGVPPAPQLPTVPAMDERTARASWRICRKMVEWGDGGRAKKHTHRDMY